MKYVIKLFNLLNEKERGAINTKEPQWKDLMGFSKTVCELPYKLNKDKVKDIIHIYLFNEEYKDKWTHFIIEKVE